MLCKELADSIRSSSAANAVHQNVLWACSRCIHRSISSQLVSLDHASACNACIANRSPWTKRLSRFSFTRDWHARGNCSVDANISCTDYLPCSSSKSTALMQATFPCRLLATFHGSSSMLSELALVFFRCEELATTTTGQAHLLA